MMSQNWWEKFPEIQPSPAARPRPLPGPGGIIPGAAMAQRAGMASAAIDPLEAPLSVFEPSYFSEDASPDRSALRSRFSHDDGAPVMDRDGAFQQAAAAAIQRGADPNLVRGRLQQIGLADFDPQSPFSDLVPGGQHGHSGGDAPGQPQAEPRPSTNVSTFADQMPFTGAIGKQEADRKHALTARAFQTGEPPEDPFTHMMAADERGAVQQNHAPSQKNLGLSNAGVETNLRPSATARSGRSAEKIRFGLNGYGYVPQRGDAQMLARAIYAESGITPGDMPAIGWSVINRVGFRNGTRLPFGSTLADVLNQRAANGLFQYSFMNNGGSQAWRDSANPSQIPAPGQAAWARAVAVANAILSDRLPDPSGGAHYYFASPSYVPGSNHTAPSDYPAMLDNHRYAPTPYQSNSTFRDRQGRIVRNYFFSENPEKLWVPVRRPTPNGRGQR